MGGEDNSPSKRERHKKVGNIEETKMNFFDPQKYGEAQAPYEKAQEDQMIEARFDPVDWRAELERVYLDLAEIEKDMMQARHQGGGMSEDVEEVKRHMDLIQECC